MKPILVRLICALLVISLSEAKGQEPAATTAQKAPKGVPALQEVEATGTGATENEAFKQAVVDAVRQVVGTLVSAENVVMNDRVIKDEVLTLSNGFVEKVLTQDKSRMADGTWQVKLTCTVRKGQLYGKLRGANIRTINFEGDSIFADVVSQISLEKEAAALLTRAMLEWNGDLYEAVSISSKPEIVSKSDESVKIRMACRVTLRRTVYESHFVPRLKKLFESLAIDKFAGVLNRDQERNLLSAEKMPIHINGAEEGYVFPSKTIKALTDRTRTEWLGANGGVSLVVFAVFRESSGACVLIRKHKKELYTGTRKLGSFYITPRFSSGSADEPDSDSQFINFDVEIPIESLAKITKIELHVHTTLDRRLTYNNLPTDAPVLFDASNGGVNFIRFKPGGKVKDVGEKNFYYVPTLLMTDDQFQGGE